MITIVVYGSISFLWTAVCAHNKHYYKRYTNEQLLAYYSHCHSKARLVRLVFVSASYVAMLTVGTRVLIVLLDLHTHSNIFERSHTHIHTQLHHTLILPFPSRVANYSNPSHILLTNTPSLVLGMRL